MAEEKDTKTSCKVLIMDDEGKVFIVRMANFGDMWDVLPTGMDKKPCGLGGGAMYIKDSTARLNCIASVIENKVNSFIMKNFKVATIIGTRPEIIRLSAVIKLFDKKINQSQFAYNPDNWARMEAILDQKGRKPLAFYWRSAAAILAAAGISSLLLFQNQANQLHEPHAS